MMSGNNIFSEYIETLEKQDYLSKKVNIMEKMNKGIGVLSNVTNVAGGLIGCVGASLSACLPETKQRFVALGFGLGSLFAGGYISSKLYETQKYVGGRIAVLVDEWNKAEQRQKELEEKSFGFQDVSLSFNANQNTVMQDAVFSDEDVDIILEEIVLGEDLDTIQENDNLETLNNNTQNENNASVIAKQIIDSRQITLEE